MKTKTWEDNYDIIDVHGIACHVPKDSYKSWYRICMAMHSWAYQFGVPKSEVAWFIHCHGEFNFSSPIHDVKSYWKKFANWIKKVKK